MSYNQNPSVSKRMKREAEELKALLQYKKQTISELDRLLYQEITTQNILNQLIAENSIQESLSQASSRSESISGMESSFSSIGSSQLMAEMESVNQFMMNCVRGKTWGRVAVSKQDESSVKKPETYAPLQMSECNFPQRSGADRMDSNSLDEQKRHFQIKQQVTYKQRTVRKRQQKYSLELQIKKKPQITTMQLRQEQTRKERQAIRNALIQEQQRTQLTLPDYTTNKIIIPLPRHIIQQQTAIHSFDLESFRRKSTLNRTINQIRRAKRKGEQLQQSISSQLTCIRF